MICAVRSIEVNIVKQRTKKSMMNCNNDMICNDDKILSQFTLLPKLNQNNLPLLLIGVHSHGAALDCAIVAPMVPMLSSSESIVFSIPEYTYTYYQK